MPDVDTNGDFTEKGLAKIIETIRADFDSPGTVKFQNIRIHDEVDTRDLTPVSDTLIP